MLKRAAIKNIETIKEKTNASFNIAYSDNFSWLRKNRNILIFCGIALFIIVFFVLQSKGSNSSVNNVANSNPTKDNCPNGDYSSSFYDNDCGTKPEEKICKGSDLRYYDKPKNAYCDGLTTPQGWTCNKGFTAKSEGDRKGDHTSWFCECNSSQVSCLGEISSNLIDGMSDEIEKQKEYLNTIKVNQYSQRSVDNYNSQVQNLNNLIGKRNRYMSENCLCPTK